MKNIDISQYDGSVQVQKIHYDFLNYVNLERWDSYYHQIEETLAFNPKSVLIVGVGDNIVGTILSQQNVNITTFDFDETLYPDILGDITNIKNILQGKKFDVLICCQVLEHLPYENFEQILQQFSEITNNVVISLPYSPAYFQIDIKIPRIRERRMLINIHKGYKKFVPNKQHYWEIGYKGFSKRKIQKSITKYFEIKKQFTAKNCHYHLFFTLTKVK
jgi:hypothetical protein